MKVNKMDINKVILVRGFDLYFSDASDETIERIAMQLGGNYDFLKSEQLTCLKVKYISP